MRRHILQVVLPLLITQAACQTFDPTQLPPVGTFYAPPCPGGRCLPGPYPTMDKVPDGVPLWTNSVNLTAVPTWPPRPSSMEFGILCNPGDSMNASLGASGMCDYTCGNKCWRDEVTMCPGQGQWGVTYDDGPSDYTPALLDHLLAINTKVTFFVIGSRIMERPDVLHRAYAEGHQICLHTWSHASNTALTNEQIIAETYWTARAVYQVIGVVPTCMRWPYGDSDDRTRFVLRALGLKVVTWNHDTVDWSITDPAVEAQTVTGNFTNWINAAGPAGGNSKTGFISLEHDLFNASASAAPLALTLLQKANYTIKRVGDCNNWPSLYIDTSKPINTGLNPALIGAPVANATSSTAKPTGTATGTAVIRPSAIANVTGASSNGSGCSKIGVELVGLVVLSVTVLINALI
ncbi:hypothetical protein SmJEL517_g05060 [Synchytrium microbalum]|uniref:NodB homology domain-containing protein n=1 Tax=Synchytrium microbalum TaxID=1806994 RepID=A0A507BXV5_9FUNG|nr:uncharacterized protein SmJEL517_g05060 [Synchytrium microbalum]TPX31689.1 hypothetical protein SmJEL517_g05060 [Synchytrium microbalum]